MKTAIHEDAVKAFVSTVLKISRYTLNYMYTGVDLDAIQAVVYFLLFTTAFPTAVGSSASL